MIALLVAAVYRRAIGTGPRVTYSYLEVCHLQLHPAKSDCVACVHMLCLKAGLQGPLQ